MILLLAALALSAPPSPADEGPVGTTLAVRRHVAPRVPADLTEDVSCTLRVAVDRKGRPTEVTFHEGCPEPARRAFAEAVRRWRFARPRDEEGRPTDTAITLTMALDVTPADDADRDDDTSEADDDGDRAPSGP